MPLALQVSSASLGAVTMYRTTAQELFGGLSEFMKSLRLFFQGVFLLASFHVALSLEPMLSPDPEDRVEYTRNDGNIGMKIDIRYVLRRSWEFGMLICGYSNLTFAYPGRDTPTLHDVNFHVKPGEVVAIVGKYRTFSKLVNTLSTL
jgi:ABC-type multidrug transport system fused ATPase/permease subunit